jgi:hypothetical protein
MSQYQFTVTMKNLKKSKVLMGWDRPLQYHYLVVGLVLRLANFTSQLTILSTRPI